MRKPTPKYWLYSESALRQALENRKKRKQTLLIKVALYDLEINEIQDALEKHSFISPS